MTTTFDSKAALITGGGSGIGLATATRFASLGAAVTICGRTEERLAAGRAAILEKVPGASVTTVVADVTVEDQIAAAVEAAAAVTAAAAATDEETLAPCTWGPCSTPTSKVSGPPSIST